MWTWFRLCLRLLHCEMGRRVSQGSGLCCLRSWAPAQSLQEMGVVPGAGPEAEASGCTHVWLHVDAVSRRAGTQTWRCAACLFRQPRPPRTSPAMSEGPPTGPLCGHADPAAAAWPHTAPERRHFERQLRCSLK
ncbi:unnamed protein product [Rangifer tarandus platyrhynchus]|uniref:Secreted protein n=1 Tax=Rangifer tarandus platyrhynchus TaxID=3082113 RepID=A0ABN8Z109_RANTA|nr:unnamed protein product [Rangifer tarandus platyrhynchus]